MADKRYHIYYTYADKDLVGWDHATTYDTKAEAWNYIQRLAERALETGTMVDMQLTDQQTGVMLLTMVVQNGMAYAIRTNQKSASGVTGFVVAKR